jgi:hypothetical protein
MAKPYQSGMEFDYIIFDSLNLFGCGGGQRDQEFILRRGLRPNWNDGTKKIVF